MDTVPAPSNFPSSYNIPAYHGLSWGHWPSYSSNGTINSHQDIQQFSLVQAPSAFPDLSSMIHASAGGPHTMFYLKTLLSKPCSGPETLCNHCHLPRNSETSEGTLKVTAAIPVSASIASWITVKNQDYANVMLIMLTLMIKRGQILCTLIAVMILQLTCNLELRSPLATCTCSQIQDGQRISPWEPGEGVRSPVHISGRGSNLVCGNEGWLFNPCVGYQALNKVRVQKHCPSPLNKYFKKLLSA